MCDTIPHIGCRGSFLFHHLAVGRHSKYESAGMLDLHCLRFPWVGNGVSFWLLITLSKWCALPFDCICLSTTLYHSTVMWHTPIRSSHSHYHQSASAHFHSKPWWSFPCIAKISDEFFCGIWKSSSKAVENFDGRRICTPYVRQCKPVILTNVDYLSG